MYERKFDVLKDIKLTKISVEPLALTVIETGIKTFYELEVAYQEFTTMATRLWN